MLETELFLFDSKGIAKRLSLHRNVRANIERLRKKQHSTWQRKAHEGLVGGDEQGDQDEEGPREDDHPGSK